MLQDRLDDLVGPLVGGETQLMVGLDGIVPPILQGVSIDLVEQADVAPLLAVVDQHPPFAGDDFHRGVELLAAVALDRAQGIAGQTFGMDPDNGNLGHRLGEESEVLFASFTKGLDPESPVPGRQGGYFGNFDFFHKRIILNPPGRPLSLAFSMHRVK